MENKKIKYREANSNDVYLFFRWANEQITRQQSFNTNPITFEEHESWFFAKLKEPATQILVFENEANIPIGQVRIEQRTEEVIIGISVDALFRNKGFAPNIIKMACERYFENFDAPFIHAYIKVENIASAKSFEKAGFMLFKETEVSNHKCFVYRISKM